MENFTKKDIENIKELLESIVSSLKLSEKESLLKELETETTDPNFWKDTNRAKVVMKQIEKIKKESNTARLITNDVNSLLKL